MEALQWVFIIGLAIVFYSYLGYGVVLGLLLKLFAKKAKFENIPNDQLPEVALLIGA